MSDAFIKTAVIGHPITHSKSPLIHGYWREKYGLQGSYEPLDIHPNGLAEAVGSMVEQGFTGFNVTVPHKTAIMDICDEVDDLATLIGAVNTVTIKEGKLHGTNTDAYGFIENIKQNAPNFKFTGCNAIVLGAGGAANAVVYALLQEGVSSIVIANRTLERAKNLADHFPDRVLTRPWEEKNNLIGSMDIPPAIIVNTTALGMVGNPELDVDLSAAPSDCLVTDIVYAPLMTGLLQQAKARDLQIVTGIGMLLHQARPGFEKWNGVLPEVTDALLQKVLA